MESAPHDYCFAFGLKTPIAGFSSMAQRLGDDALPLLERRPVFVRSALGTTGRIC